MLGIGDAHELTNTGRIVVRGDRAAGMREFGTPDLETTGADLTVSNAGRIHTEGQAAIGVLLGASRFGLRPAVDGNVVNSGVITTEATAPPVSRSSVTAISSPTPAASPPTATPSIARTSGCCVPRAC